MSSHCRLERFRRLALRRPAFRGVRLGVRFPLLGHSRAFEFDQIIREFDCHEPDRKRRV
jgi:hypothetical protein